MWQKFKELFLYRKVETITIPREGYDKIINDWRDLVISRDAEIRRLTDLILTNYGVIKPENHIPKSEGPKQINNRPQSARQRMQFLAAEDARRNAEAIKARYEGRIDGKPTGIDELVNEIENAPKPN